MAVRPVYSATIEFKFDKKGLGVSLDKIENIVQATVKSVSKSMSGITIDMPDIGAAIGKRGGISKTTERIAKQIRSVVRDSFKDIEEVTDVGIDQALLEAADRIGTTSDKIVRRLSRMTDDSGKEFKRLTEIGIREADALYMALIGRSSITDLAIDIVEKFVQMSDKSVWIFKRMTSDIVSVTDAASDKISQSLESAIRPDVRAGGIDEKRLREMFGPPDTEDLRYGPKRAIEQTAHDLSGLAGEIKNTSSAISQSFGDIASSIVDALSSVSKIAAGPFTTAMKLVEVKANVAAAEIRTTRGVIDRFGESIKEARAASVGFGKKGIGTVAVLALGDGAKKAAEAVRDVTFSLQDVKIAAAEAFRLKKLPIELLGIEGVRKEVARVEEIMARMPDKTSASFKALQRQFSEVRSEAIKAQKQFDKGLINEEQLASSAEKLRDITNEVRRFKSTELERLNDQLDRNAKAVSLTSRTVSEKMRDMRDGITLASETGENKLLSLRLAMFGVGEATGPVSRLLDRFTSNVDDVGKAEGKLVEITSRVTKSLADRQGALKDSIKTLKDVGKLEGLQSDRLNQIDRQASNVEKAYKEMTTSIEATGKATPRQLAGVRNEYRRLEESISLVKEQNKDAIGPDTLKAFSALESRIKDNIPATRILATTVGKASKALDDTKKSSDNLDGSLSKSVGIFARLKNMIFGTTKAMDKQAKSMANVEEHTVEMSEVMERIGIEFFGALGADVLLGVFDRVTHAISNLAESSSSQIEKNTQRITRAFGLLPGEAEVVANVISDVWKSNLGGSIDEVGEATQRAVARFRDLGVTSQEEIAGVTKDAFRLSEVYQFNVPESLDAAAVLMKQFNLTTKESTDFLAGLGKAGIIGSDALDSVLEYATQIKSAGGNADTLFNVIKSGFAGGGTLGTDKAVDLFKEFRLLIASGSKDVKNALNEIGINSNALFAQMADGTINTTQAFEFVRGKLAQINDDNAVTRIGAALMGTQFEDMGNQMALAISTVGTTMADLAGTSDSLAANYTDLGSGIEAINRRMEATFSPLKDAFLGLAMQAIPPILAGIDALRPSIDAISDRVRILIAALTGGDWDTAQGVVIGAMTNIAEYASLVLEWLIASGFDWGANFVIEIANGLIETASQVIVDAMNFISGIMESFLKGSSPPKEGPLSDIDKWGGPLMESFGKGFTSADFKFVDQALAPIKSAFEKEFGKEGFEGFEGVRDRFTEVVAQINKTGVIDEAKFKEIEEAIGPANTELTKMLGIQLKLKKVNKDLADAQEDVTDAEAAGFVSEGLKKKLQAAEEEVDVAKENVEWQKEFLEFQGLSEESFGGMARNAAKVGSAAAGGAARATKAIKGAVDRQLQFIQGGFDKEKALLEQKFEAGLIGEEKYLKELIKLEEKYVDTSLNKGLLSGAELSKWGERIATLKSSLEDVKTTSEKIKPIGSAIFGETETEGLTGKVGQNILTGAKDIGKGIGDSIAAGLVESSKTKMKEAFTSIADNIGVLFREKILARITPKQKVVGGLIGSVLLGIGVSGILSKIALIIGKLGALSGVALRFSVIGTAIWLVWKNWDRIIAGISTALEFLTGVWTTFSDELGGSEETIATFANIFTGIKDTLTSIGSNLVNFVLDALAGESISFSDFIGIFDFSAIDTAPITKVIEAIEETFRIEAGKIKQPMFGPDGIIKIGDGEGETTRLERILANFILIFEKVETQAQSIQESFSEFMAEDRLGGRIAGLIDAISESWKALSIVIGGPLLLNLAKVISFSGRFLPILGPISTALGKLFPLVGIVTVFIGNFEKIWPPLETALGGAVLAVTGIVEAIGGIFLMFDDETRAEGVSMFFSGMTNVIGGLQETFLGLGVAIANFFISALADISGGVASILEAFDLDAVAIPFREIEEGLDGVSEWLKDALDRVKVILYGLRIQVKLILYLITKNFTEWVSGIYTTVTEWFKKLWTDLVGNSIITDMVADIAAALSLEAALEKVRLAIATMKLGFFTAKTYITTQMSLLKVAVSSKLTALSTFVSDKISALKGFVTDVKTFVTDAITAVGDLKFPTLADITEGVTSIMQSFSDFSLIDISTGVTSINESLTTMATDGLTSVQTFATDIVTAITGIDMSEDVNKMFAPLFTAIDLIKEFDASAIMSGIFSAFSAGEGEEVSFEIPDISAILLPITEAFSGLDADSATALTNIKEGLLGMFPDAAGLTEKALTFATEAATHVANLGITIGGETTTIRDTIGGIFTGIDVAKDALAYAISIATPLSGLGVTAGTEATKIATTLTKMFDGVSLETIGTAITDISTEVTTGISTMVKDALLSASTFALDFVAEIMSIPAKIKERISEFSIGDLIKSQLGMGAEVAGAFSEGSEDSVGIVGAMTSAITGLFKDEEEELVGNSIVPDMVNAIVANFNTMSTDTTATTETLTALISSRFTETSATVIDTISNMSDSILGVLRILEPTWIGAFVAMTNIVQEFGTLGKQAIELLDEAVRRLTSSVGKLQSALEGAKAALEDLRDINLDDLNSAFSDMQEKVRKARDDAKKFKKYMEAALKAAQGIGDTLGGNVPATGVPGAQHGAWNVPRDQLMFIHRKELIFPAGVAEDFRALMVTLQEAGIGGKIFSIPNRPPDHIIGGSSSTMIVTNQITAEFPNVGSADDADDIVTKLNELISDSRRLAMVGSQ